MLIQLNKFYWISNRSRVAELIQTVTGQLTDKPTCCQSSRGLVSSRTSQLAEMFDWKFGVYNSSQCHFEQVTLFIRCQYSIGLELGFTVRFNVQIKYNNSMIFKNSLLASWLVHELSSPRLDRPRVGLSASCPVTILTVTLLPAICRPELTLTLTQPCT